jgi:hypothetical protein
LLWYRYLRDLHGISEGKTHLKTKPAAAITEGGRDYVFVCMAKIAMDIDIMHTEDRPSLSKSIAIFASAVDLKLKEISPTYRAFTTFKAAAKQNGKRWADMGAPARP